MTVSTTSILRVRRTERRRGGRILRSPAAVLSLIWLIGLLLASVTGPLWLRYGPLEQDLTAVLQGPSLEHILGTDELGRDLLSRLVTAAAPTLLTALIVPVVGIVIAIPITLWAARSRRGEGLINRVSEIVLSLPGTVIILAFIAAVGTNMPLVMVMFGLLLFGALYRVFHGQAKSLHRQLFVEAAAVDGVRPMSASLRHVLPNMSSTVIVQFVLLFGVGIGMLAGLAFIGLGPQPPEPTWGGMIQAASRFIFQQPWMMVPTGGVLALTIIAANALADVLAGGSAMPPPLVAIRRKKSRTPETEISASAFADDMPAGEAVGNEAQEGLTMIGDASIPSSNIDPTRNASPAHDVIPVAELSSGVESTVESASAGAIEELDAALSPAAARRADGELVVQDLVIGVDGGPALVTGVSLRVRPGTVMGLVGESGCGKSVTSYALLGLLSPGLSVRSGEISWNGADLARAGERTMQRVRGHEIAFISQEPTRALDPMFTISSQLSAAIKRLRGVSRSEAKGIATQLLTDVGIVDTPRVLKSYPHQISGGMAQRVAIALALAGKPSLLIADEPTTALDVTIQAEILGLLRGLIAERGMSIILVTHDLGVVADICDDVSVMYAGEIVETGSVRDVLVRPEHPYTMALLAADPHAIPDLDSTTRLASIPGQVPLPGSWTAGCRFAPRCRFARDECLVTVPLEPRAVGRGAVRCVRRDEVRGRQEEWRLPVTTGGHR
ncbi:dipeptide/oligopeptide/nickel ABC transporter permease/ATP-binding protein [Microbacterium sp.]|uniref:dipeptide/oligopeptide/nickel ABC transporter permease/ATP-binding protein n=1 Tax=Microbacterium sp. TaxID=51671 RepID=UPI002E322473|nr:dipeptide/oligopeptide/nickel ABC transporter permease/ATP-binding protein [Microbacterium sp.]HEX5729508.1 dipeptide/oligopeptide/nickel ABC transporter permease/ATP-binding protein [Microbacterium sp.]